MSDTRAARPHLAIARSSDSCVTRSSVAGLLGRHPAHRDGHRRVAEEAVELHPHVDRDDVALDQRPLRRDAVHDLLVHRRAHGRRIAVIALERRLGAPPRAPASASRVEVAVVAPGTTSARSSLQDAATSWLARRSFSISAGDRQTITALPLRPHTRPPPRVRWPPTIRSTATGPAAARRHHPERRPPA
jgi:hypothetical protein